MPEASASGNAVEPDHLLAAVASRGALPYVKMTADLAARMTSTPIDLALTAGAVTELIETTSPRAVAAEVDHVKRISAAANEVLHHQEKSVVKTAPALEGADAPGSAHHHAVDTAHVPEARITSTDTYQAELLLAVLLANVRIVETASARIVGLVNVKTAVTAQGVTDLGIMIVGMAAGRGAIGVRSQIAISLVGVVLAKMRIVIVTEIGRRGRGAEAEIGAEMIGIEIGGGGRGPGVGAEVAAVDVESFSGRFI